VPEWGLVCSRLQLKGLCNALEEATAESAGLKASSTGNMEDSSEETEAPLRAAESALTSHEGMHWTEVWRLLAVLKATVGEQRATGAGDDGDGDNMMEADEALDAAVEDDRWCVEGPFWRKRVTHWLQGAVHAYQQLKPDNWDVEKRLQGSNPLMAALVHLTGYRLQEAVHLVVTGARDVRLGTALAQGGGRAAGRRLLDHQLQVWRQAGILDKYIAPERLLVYELLAGHVDKVAAAMDTDLLDWRRAFGLYHWFQLSPKAGLQDMLRRYESAHQRQVAPAPAPHYEELAVGPSRVFARRRLDITYHLLCLAAGHASDLCLADGADDIDDADEERRWRVMFAPPTYSADPLEHALGWHLQVSGRIPIISSPKSWAVGVFSVRVTNL
jgi:hypothetical protein